MEPLTEKTNLQLKITIKFSNKFRSDSHDFWPSAKELTPTDVGIGVNNNVGVKRLLHGHLVDDEFMEGNVATGHLISPEGGNRYGAHSGP